MGEITLELPPEIARGTFEPQLIPKHQRRLSEFDEKILALYAKDLSTRGIQKVVKQFCDVGVTPRLVSEIAAGLDAEAKA